MALLTPFNQFADANVLQRPKQLPCVRACGVDVCGFACRLTVCLESIFSLTGVFKQVYLLFDAKFLGGWAG